MVRRRAVPSIHLVSVQFCQREVVVFDCSKPAAPIPVASFGLKADGDGRFAYGKHYLTRPEAFSPDPRHLPLQDKEIALPRQPDNTYFDICPHLEAPTRGQHIGVGAFGTASTVENALSQCGRFFLTRDEAKKVVEEVKTVASSWRRVFAEAGVSANDQYRLSGCFAVADEATAVQVNLGYVAGRDDAQPDVEKEVAPTP